MGQRLLNNVNGIEIRGFKNNPILLRPIPLLPIWSDHQCEIGMEKDDYIPLTTPLYKDRHPEASASSFFNIQIIKPDFLCEKQKDKEWPLKSRSASTSHLSKMGQLPRRSLGKNKVFETESSPHRKPHYSSSNKPGKLGISYIELKRPEMNAKPGNCDKASGKLVYTSNNQFASQVKSRSNSRKNSSVTGNTKDDRPPSDPCEPLNLSCPQRGRSAESLERLQGPHSKSMQIPCPSPQNRSTNKLTSTHFLSSPMKKLHLSGFELASQSPSRKRQSCSLKMSSSFNDISNFIADASDFNKTVMFSKISRLSCRSETHATTMPTGGSTSEQDQCTRQVKKKSFSLPCTPKRFVPLKRRLKQKQSTKMNGSGKETTFLLDSRAINNVTQQKRSQSIVCNFDNTYTVTRSRNKTHEACQNSDELIVVTHEIKSQQDKRTERSLHNGPHQDIKFQKRLFRTPSEEIQEIYNNQQAPENNALQNDKNDIVKSTAARKLIMNSRSRANRPHLCSAETKEHESDGHQNNSGKFFADVYGEAVSNNAEDLLKPDDIVGMNEETNFQPLNFERKKLCDVESIKKDCSRFASASFVNALLSARNKAHSCPPAPSR